MEDQADAQSGTPAENTGTGAGVVVKIDTKSNMLGVYQGEKLIAAYPVTVGSTHTASPIGEWKVRHITKMPTFRCDKEMLQRGKRSGNFHLLPPGPRNPVGVMWIALNKKESASTAQTIPVQLATLQAMAAFVWRIGTSSVSQRK
jgi:lipoprotein-anchoring transpeptidase ErfK/SrfK